MKATKAFVRKNKFDRPVYFAKVVFDNVATLNGFAVFNNNEGNGFWVAPPSHKGKDKDGSDKYFKDLWIDPETKEGKELLDSIQEVVTMEIRKEQHATKKQNQTSSNPENDLADDVDSLF